VRLAKNNATFLVQSSVQKTVHGIKSKFSVLENERRFVPGSTTSPKGTRESLKVEVSCRVVDVCLAMAIHAFVSASNLAWCNGLVGSKLGKTSLDKVLLFIDLSVEPTSE
jgi:hypothetical protein